MSSVGKSIKWLLVLVAIALTMGLGVIAPTKAFAEVEVPTPKITFSRALVKDTPEKIELAAGEKAYLKYEANVENLLPNVAYRVHAYAYKDGELFESHHPLVFWTADPAGTYTLTDSFYNWNLEAGTYTIKLELWKDKGWYGVGEETTAFDDKLLLTHNDDLSNATDTVIVTIKGAEPIDDSVTVKINKTDMDGNDIDDAQIAIKDSKGAEVATWTSKVNEIKEITVKPGDYTLIETSAPDEYQKVTSEISFTVDAEGKGTVNTQSIKPAGACEFVDGVLVLKNATKDPPSIPTPQPESEISTIVSAGDKTASVSAAVELTTTEAAKVSKVTDKVMYTNVPAGKYVLVGYLMSSKDNYEEPVAEAIKAVTVEEGSENGSWIMEFDGVKLEEDTKYVVFEYLVVADSVEQLEEAISTGTEPIVLASHEDSSDKAQTIVVGKRATTNKAPASAGKTTATPAGKTTAKTSDDMGGVALASLVLAVVAVGVGLVARRNSSQR